MRLIILFFIVLIHLTSNAQIKEISEKFNKKGWKEIDVNITISSGLVKGTLTSNTNTKKGPLVIFVGGSGPVDRNGNLPGIENNSLLLLSHALVEKGIASVRFDKKGVGASVQAGIDEDSLRIEHYVEDVREWVQYFKEDSTYSEIVVLGHSEGSLIGMLASNSNVDKFISLAGLGYPVRNTLKMQLSMLPEELKNRSFNILDSVENNHKVKNVPLPLQSIFRESIQGYLTSWMKYDPSVEIGKLKIPCLIINGTKDLQVETTNAEMLNRSVSNSELIIVEKMNHVLKEVDSVEDNISAYGDPKRPLSNYLIEKVVFFINN